MPAGLMMLVVCMCTCANMCVCVGGGERKDTEEVGCLTALHALPLRHMMLQLDPSSVALVALGASGAGPAQGCYYPVLPDRLLQSYGVVCFCSHFLDQKTPR